MKILFFDSDTTISNYFSNPPLLKQELFFFSESFNHLSLSELKKYTNADIISVFAHTDTLSKKRLDLFQNLKLISTRSTGFNHIDLNYTKEREILVCNVPNYGEITVGEFTIGLILNLSHKIMLAKSQLKQNNVRIKECIGKDVFKQTLGVIGTGSIGKYVIKLAHSLGMSILAYDPFPSKELLRQGIIYVKRIDDLFKNSDIISLHCPATKENYHLLNKKAFSQMKKGVLIINTARGSLIDTEALYDALRSDIIGGAALDVLESEDILTEREISLENLKPDFLLDSVINFKLLLSDKTIITPHIAFNSIDAIDRILKTSFENIVEFLKGRPQNIIK